MYRGHQIVAVTPAGRRRYLDVLRHYLHRARGEGTLDRWDVWVNTLNPKDLLYLEALARDAPYVRLLREGDPARGIRNIHTFFGHCREEGTVYVRLDDDIVYLHERFFPNLLDFRLAHRQYLLVSANVVNNALCGHLHQRLGVLGAERGLVGYRLLDPLGWRDGPFAEYAHRTFLADVARSEAHRWFIQDWVFHHREPFSINAVAFLGERMREVGGRVGELEERWLTHDYPRESGLLNAVCGRALAAHFAFFPQRQHLDGTDLLARYRSACAAACGRGDVAQSFDVYGG